MKQNAGERGEPPVGVGARAEADPFDALRPFREYLKPIFKNNFTLVRVSNLPELLANLRYFCCALTSEHNRRFATPPSPRDASRSCRALPPHPHPPRGSGLLIYTFGVNNP